MEAPTSIPRYNPFRGLRPFEQDENHLFFGRDGQTEALLHRLRKHRFLAVVGTSGSGKSSLVRAGLLPALYGGFMGEAGSGWRIAIMRPGGHPMQRLARALNSPDVFGFDEEADDFQSLLTETTLQRSAQGLVNAVRLAQLPEGENLLVVVDQFEELFRFSHADGEASSREEATAFVKLLLEATRQTDLGIFVVITMRSDFLGDCAQFRDLPEAINDSQYLIPRMTRDQRQAAIAGPVGVAGGQISPRLVQVLLNDMGDDPDQLPILQHALMRTWNNWEARSTNGGALDVPDYEAVGGMADALSNHANEAFAALLENRPTAEGERLQRLAERLFRAITERGPDNREVRRPLRLHEICTIADCEQHEMVTVIDTFRSSDRSFLMPPQGTPLTGESRIDIAHESLIRQWDQLQEWVAREVEDVKTYRRIADAAEQHSLGRR